MTTAAITMLIALTALTAAMLAVGVVLDCAAERREAPWRTLAMIRIHRRRRTWDLLALAMTARARTPRPPAAVYHSHHTGRRL